MTIRMCPRCAKPVHFSTAMRRRKSGYEEMPGRKGFFLRLLYSLFVSVATSRTFFDCDEYEVCDDCGLAILIRQGNT